MKVYSFTSVKTISSVCDSTNSMTMTLTHFSILQEHKRPNVFATKSYSLVAAIYYDDTDQINPSLATRGDLVLLSIGADVAHCCLEPPDPSDNVDNTTIQTISENMGQT